LVDQLGRYQMNACRKAAWCVPTIETPRETWGFRHFWFCYLGSILGPSAKLHLTLLSVFGRRRSDKRAKFTLIMSALRPEIGHNLRVAGTSAFSQ
jgi:hypothetical protein